jgi:hypothetical protein
MHNTEDLLKALAEEMAKPPRFPAEPTKEETAAKDATIAERVEKALEDHKAAGEGIECP